MTGDLVVIRDTIATTDNSIERLRLSTKIFIIRVITGQEMFRVKKNALKVRENSHLSVNSRNVEIITLLNH